MSASDPQEKVVSLYETSKTIYTRTIKGWFYHWRLAFVVFTQAIFYGLAWVSWDDRQAVLFDIVERKFYLFGLTLFPQDVIYLSVILIISAYALFLFTAVAGRLFCGYACPQSVYTEIFMLIERWVEGDRNARIALDKAPLSAKKIRLKTLKHSLWLIVALWTGFTFIGYFAPIRELANGLLTWSLGPWQLFWLFFYSFATYGNAGWMREQVCKYMCPYARFQSVMFDKDTLIVSYDVERGEPRGARKKGEESKLTSRGDCVDCGFCVQVCPTGIDIRNGLQYECIGCGLCIDACNSVMDKLHLKRGLVRYTSESGLKNHWDFKEMIRHLFRPRILFYSSILGAIVIFFFGSLATRDPLKANIIRDRSAISRILPDGVVEGVFQVRLLNTDRHAHRVHLSVEGIEGINIVNPMPFEVPAESTRTFVFNVHVPQKSVGLESESEDFSAIPKDKDKREKTKKEKPFDDKFDIRFNIRREGDESRVIVEKSTFLVPRR